MKKGVTLLESLLVLLLIGWALMLSKPLWQLNDAWLLAQEQQRLYYFLQAAFNRAENSSGTWALLANRDPVTADWCFTLQLANEAHRCNCLQKNHCPTELYAQFFYPLQKGKVNLSANSLYQQEITRLNSVRHSEKAACFRLQLGEQKVIFSFANYRLSMGDEAAGACA